MKSLVSLVALSLCLSGCAGWRQARESWKRNQAPDVSISREERRAQVAKEFDQKRDDAQFEAAIARWQTGDAEGAKKLLTALLARNENHQRGRMLLADIHVFSGDNAAAILVLEKAVAAAPQDAAVQHSLAQVLDAEGRRDESLLHYQRAAKLDTESDLYQLSYDTAVAGGNSESQASHRERPAGFVDASKSKDLMAPAAAPKSLPAAKLPGATERWSSKPPVVPVDAKPCTCGAHASCPAFPIDGVPQCNHQHCDAKQCDGVDCACPRRGKPAETSIADEKTNPMGFAVACDESAPSEKTSPLAAGDVPTKPNRPQAPVVRPVAYVSPARETRAEPEPKSTNTAALPASDPLTTAVTALADGDNDAAIDAATAGLAASPAQAAPLYRVLGTAHYRRGEFQAAQSALSQALSLDKTDALAYFLMGTTLAKQGEHEAAAIYLAEAARLDPRFAH